MSVLVRGQGSATVFIVTTILIDAIVTVKQFGYKLNDEPGSGTEE